MKKYKTDIDVIDLVGFMKNHTNEEAAKYFHVSKATISRRLCDLGMNYYELKHGDLPRSLSSLQQDLLNGTMLGDGTINRKSLYYCFSQSIERKEYVRHIETTMQPFVAKFDIIPSNDKNKRPNDTCYVRTITSPIFRECRSRWYDDRRKIIPSDLQLNARTVAYWFCDNGNNLPHRKRISFATQSFTRDEVSQLQKLLLQLGLRTTLGKDYFAKPILTIWQRDYLLFLDMVRQYIPWKCFANKLDITMMPQTRQGYGAFKVKHGQATQIRSLYSTGQYTQNSLAEIFGLSRRTIHLIVNNKAHPVSKNLGIQGSAHVTASYNYN